jgi:drug/metabolite transporter (DMT)-like permease
MAWAFLGEEIVALQLLGMAVVLFALGGIVLGQPKSTKSDID